jgi:predicted DNA-binding protein YlxM (UPF0122 family)
LYGLPAARFLLLLILWLAALQASFRIVLTTTVNTIKLLLRMAKEQIIYNMTELAKELKVTRQAIYKWIKKGWVKPKRDYRDYPVFTEADVKKIMKWKSAIK